MQFLITVMILTLIGSCSAIWIWGALHCAHNERMSQNDRARWIMIILLVPVFGAVAYLYRHRGDSFTSFRGSH
jgi:hypothetical protein